MHVHSRLRTLVRSRPWAIVTVVGDKRRVLKTFRSRESAQRHLDNTWPGHDSTTTRVEQT